MAGLKMMGMGLMALEQAVPLLGAATEEGQAVLSTIQKIAKMVPPGTVTPADMMTVMQKLMTQQQQFGQQMNQMRKQATQPAAPGGAPPGGAPGGAAPPAQAA